MTNYARPVRAGQKTCSECGSKVTSKNPRAQFCSRRCAAKAANARPQARRARVAYGRSVRGKAARTRSLHRTTWPRTLHRLYGLTVEDYAWMLHRQDFRCAICGQQFTTEPVANTEQGKRVKPNVDHSHKTGEVRGIVCGWCNYRFLGPLERGGVARTIRAVAYLGWGTVTVSSPEPDAMRQGGFGE